MEIIDRAGGVGDRIFCGGGQDDRVRGLATETIVGLGISGPEKWVRSLTGNLKLLR